MIRPVKESDADAILNIYNYYIENTVITFEELPLSLAEMSARILTISASYPYLVREDEGELTGYAYVNTWKERTAYKYSAEASVYLKHGTQGKGRGKELLGSLLEAVRLRPLHVLISGITLPNEPSIGMVEHFGFKKIGQFYEVGFKKGQWLDVGYWELIL
ncbi:MAG: GNAT family N-acetyltransferase [Treponema sp.]|nr:GNAT family N-acetyltransferase [Treponema sp.]